MAKQEDKSVEIRIGEYRENGRTTTTSSSSNTTRINQITPTQIEAGIQIQIQRTPTGNFAGKLFKLLFFIHLVGIATLITFLTIGGFIAGNPKFHPFHWYIPLLTSTTFAALTALTWLLITLHYPSKALTTSLWLSPLLTCATGILLIAAGTGYSLAFAALALVFALVQSLYACWVTPRLPFARQILSVSLPAAQASIKITKFVVIALIVSIAYSWFWILGVGGVTAHGSPVTALYIFALLISLAWAMQVVKNVVHVAVSRIGYMHLMHGMEIDACEAFRDAVRGCSFGSVCFGSVVAPIIGAFRGLARTMNLVAGDSDEFLFSCANCYMGIANQIMSYGNRWGFVHVGVYEKGFARASGDTWEMFVKVGIDRLIDLDLTGSFCFLCGVAGGALSAMVAGSWVLAVDKDYATGVTVYAFFIGYFMNRIAISWPQACVSAYYVAYAENPQSNRFDSTIPGRIRSLQSYGD